MSSGICLLSAIGECHRRLRSHAIHLREIAKVLDVKHVVEMPELVDAYRLEEYVDAELVSGEAISWCFEITKTRTTILVEADVRRIHSDGQDIVKTLGEFQYSTEAECSAQLPEIATRLCSAYPLKLMSPDREERFMKNACQPSFLGFQKRWPNNTLLRQTAIAPDLEEATRVHSILLGPNKPPISLPPFQNPAPANSATANLAPGGWQSWFS